MANKAISELPQAQNVNNQDLFVLEQSGIAKKLTAETFITEQGIIDALAEALDGHGGIQSVTLSSVSGRIRTYRITFTDQSATTFQVYDGTSIDRISRTSSSGLDDVYTIFLSDGTTTFFTVHNGADGTVSEAMLNDALKDKAPAITETTESSAIANFPDGADDMAMHNVVAEINPVQDLNGYDNPWPAGSGKNLFGGSYNELFELHIPSGTTICAYCDNTATINYYGADGQTRIDYWTVSSAGRVFTLTADAYYFRFNGASEGATPTKMYIAIENAFSGYLPYSNICPISGHTEVNVTRTGKNLCSTTIGRYVWASGVRYSNNGKYCAFEDKVAVKGGEQIAVSFTDAGTCSSVYFAFFNGETYISQFIKWGAPWIASVPDNANMVALSFINNVDYTTSPVISNVMLTYGSSATAYEPYQGTTLTVDWTSEAGTVYGGTIDVTTGVLTVTWAMITIDGSTSLQVNGATANTSKFGLSVTGKANGRRNILSNMFAYPVGVTDVAGAVIGRDGNNFVEFSLPPDVAQTVAAGKAWFADNPTQLCYELATPQTYQLTPQEVKTLLGTNNVWADTGNVSVTYPADTKMFIEKLTMPTEDDLVANQAITSGKYFMIGNSLYLALANIASGAQITIGTNAQRVSLADALNTINS